MKILLSGANGLLGKAVVRAAGKAGHTCTALARPEINAAALSALTERLCGYDLVIHAGANTNVEQCEIQYRDCYRDNLLLTELISRAARRVGIKMAFVSSTGIYGAHKTEPYCEFDEVQPTTHHHRSKYLAEQCVLSANPENLVIRTGWLFGGEPENPKNFVVRRIEEARAAISGSGFIQSNQVQRGVPSACTDVATRMLALAAYGLSGVFNCVNTGNASRYEYVKAITELANLSIEVRPVEAGAFNRKARVSDNEMAENWKMSALSLPDMPDWKTSLGIYINEELP